MKTKLTPEFNNQLKVLRLKFSKIEAKNRRFLIVHLTTNICLKCTDTIQLFRLNDLKRATLMCGYINI